MRKYEESTTIELKQEVNADFKKEIIAFANTSGGEIFVGISKQGDPIGVLECEEVMAQIGNMIRDGIKPDLTAYTTIEAIEENGLKIIRVSIMRGTKRPYYLSDKGLKSTGVFVRHGVSSVPATDEAIRNMLRENDGAAFDKSRSFNQELTFDYARKYFEHSNLSFTRSNHRTLGLLDVDGYYTNAALLLSDQCEYSIKCAVYKGKGKTEFKARKEFFGSVLKQIEDAYEYINLNNNNNTTFNGIKRVDHFDYPSYALREALLNTVVHRDYDYTGSILVNIYEDRIEFVSLGGLVKGITLEDIFGGVSQPRNMVIANIFYRLELIESYGTGIQRIIESYQDCIYKPMFKTAPASFVVILPKMTNINTTNMESGLTQEERVMALFEIKNEITRMDVEMLLKCPKHTALIILGKLMDEGKIKKIGLARAAKYTCNINN